MERFYIKPDEKKDDDIPLRLFEITNDNLRPIITSLLTRLEQIHKTGIRLLDINSENIVFIGGSADNVKYIRPIKYCQKQCTKTFDRDESLYRKDDQIELSKLFKYQTYVYNNQEEAWKNDGRLRENGSWRLKKIIQDYENFIQIGFTYDKTDDFFALSKTLLSILTPEVLGKLSTDNQSWLQGVIDRLTQLTVSQNAIDALTPTAGGRRRSKTRRRRSQQQKKRRQSRRN